jgi:hypothetical protein
MGYAIRIIYRPGPHVGAEFATGELCRINGHTPSSLARLASSARNFCGLLCPGEAKCLENRSTESSLSSEENLRGVGCEKRCKKPHALGLDRVLDLVWGQAPEPAILSGYTRTGG